MNDRKSIREIVQEISLADIVETSSVDSIVSDVSENVFLARKVREKIVRNSVDATEAYAIDGVPFNVRRRQIRLQVDEIMNSFAEQSKVSNEDVLPRERGTFTEWLNQSHQNKNHAAAPAAETAVDEQERNSESSSTKSSVGRTIVKSKKCRSRRRPNTLNRLAGYMNGPFLREKSQAATLDSSDRFGIPFSMIDRAKKEQERREIQADVLRRVRLSHMGYRQPPSKDDSSDNESVQNVKRLALLRTPYFLVPTIKISQVRKKERIRNKFLRKDRLNRINLLLFDRTKKSMEKPRPIDDELAATADDDTVQLTKKHQYFAKFFQMSSKTKSSAPPRDPMKAKYCKIIFDKYAEHRLRCAPNDQVRIRCGFVSIRLGIFAFSFQRKHRLTFDEFKCRQSPIGADTIKAKECEPTDGNKTEMVNYAQRNRAETIEVAEKLFASACRSKQKLHKAEPVDGPLYIDPHLNEKVKNPQKCKWNRNWGAT